MIKKSLGRFDYEQKAIDKGLKLNLRSMNISGLVESQKDIEPLFDALKNAKVPHHARVAASCLEKVEKFDFVKRLRISYVLAYIFDFGEDGEYTDNPCWKINDALCGGLTLPLFYTRKLIWGLLCGLRTLPHKQFTTLYRGLKSTVEWHKGDVIKIPCFTSTTKEMSVARSFLNTCEDGRQEGTLITIKDGWGYDLEELSTITGEHGVLMEPEVSVLVESVESSECGRVVKIDLKFVKEGDFLTDCIPRVEEGSTIEPSDNESYFMAMDLKRHGDYERSYDILHKLCCKQHFNGKVEFAIMNLFGDHPTKGDQQFGYLLLMSCRNLKNGKVSYELGACYQMGYGVEKDMNESNDYFLKSLLCGYTPATSKCEELVKHGIDREVIEKNREMYEYIKKVGGGYGVHFGIWGYCLIHGIFEDKNVDEGYKLVKRSAERGSSFGQNILGDCYDHGWGVPKDVKKAFECYKLSAEEGDSDGQRKLGLCYQKGTGVDKDFVEAARLFKQSAEQDNPDSQYLLAHCYLNGKGVDKDMTEAVRLFRLSAEQGNEKAHYVLEYLCPESECVSEELARPTKVLKTPEEQEEHDEQYEMGFCYYVGFGVEKNCDEAIKCFKQSAERGNPDAQFMLGFLYLRGEGIENNVEEAVKWFEIAAERGNEHAQYKLGCLYLEDDSSTKGLVEEVKII